jgi:hypothetical protein
MFTVHTARWGQLRTRSLPTREAALDWAAWQSITANSAVRRVTGPDGSVAVTLDEIHAYGWEHYAAQVDSALRY